MFQALSLYRYVWVLIGTENAYQANIRRHRQKEGSSPTDSRGGPYHVCGVVLCFMWHFALRVDTGASPTDSRGGPTDSRGGPHHVCGVAFALCGTLLCVGNGF